MTGPAGNDPERRRASRSGRCGQWRWRRRIGRGHGQAGRGRGLGGADDAGWPIGQQRVGPEAGVPRPAFRVEDPDLRPPARRAEAVPGDRHLRPLADDVAAEPDPRPADQVEPQSDRGGQRIGAVALGAAPFGAVEDDEHRPGAAGEGGEPGEALGDPGGPTAGPCGSAEPGRQVDDEQVDGPGPEERPGEGEPLVEVGRREDDEPFEPDAPGDRLDRVEHPVDVEPGADRAAGLGLGEEPEGERRPAARRPPAKGEARGPRDAARPEERIEGREAGPDDRHRGRPCQRWRPHR